MQSLDINSVNFWLAEGQEHSFFNKQPWLDMTISASDEFLRTLGFIQGNQRSSSQRLRKTFEKTVVMLA